MFPSNITNRSPTNTATIAFIFHLSTLCTNPMNKVLVPIDNLGVFHVSILTLVISCTALNLLSCCTASLILIGWTFRTYCCYFIKLIIGGDYLFLWKAWWGSCTSLLHELKPWHGLLPYRPTHCWILARGAVVKAELSHLLSAYQCNFSGKDGKQTLAIHGWEVVLATSTWRRNFRRIRNLTESFYSAEAGFEPGRLWQNESE